MLQHKSAEEPDLYFNIDLHAAAGNNPGENLASAIILMAVNDWRQARWYLRKGRYRSKRRKEILQECEEFFLSEWFKELSACDGEELLEQLKTEEEKRFGKQRKNGHFRTGIRC